VFDFKAKTVLITGASYGLGESFAHAFADAGADLVLTARSTDLLEAVAEACRVKGATVTAETGDVSVEADVARVVAAGVEAHGKLDVLINNAGIADVRALPPESYDMETFQQILQVNLVGAYMYARDVGRHMLHSGGGSIVNISSYLGVAASENSMIPYQLAKGGMIQMTRQLGVEWADRGVRVNAVSPGFIITEMTRMPLEAMGIDKWIASRTPMRRLGEVGEVIAPVMFLASDAAGYMTGTNLQVDGGTTACSGAWQIPPISVEWNSGDEAPAPGGYEGIVPRPDWYQALEAGLPGVHYPMPDALD
jgi:NAD(P)-dependent dehydrogenase (short-subunit alcohol dehydrogenase family)